MKSNDLHGGLYILPTGRILYFYDVTPIVNLRQRFLTMMTNTSASREGFSCPLAITDRSYST